MSAGSAEFESWKANLLAKALERTPERKEEFATGSGIPVDRLALPDDIDNDYLNRLGFPGQYPFTRGIRPTMYRGRHWTMRQYAGFSTAEESNRRYRYLLDQGTTGLSVAFDLPTQLGYDSDHDMSHGEVGKVGVAIDSLADMETLFNEIPLDRVSTSMTINAPASILLAMYVAVGEKQGVAGDRLTGTIQNDILKEYIARGTYIFPPQPSLRLTTDIFAWCRREAPNFNTISISGYHIREAGSTAVQEIAFTLADACAYVQAALDAGLEIDEFAPRLSFFFNASSDFLEEIAKFRAARRLWAKIMRDRFQAKKAASMMLRFHTQTAGYTLTAQQVESNIVRVALQAMSAVLGGTQSLHTNSYDEALALPTERAAKTALRTQQVIAHESGVTNSIDPLAGSYLVEDLTDRLEEEAVKLMERVEKLGGMAAAIGAGFVQRQIEESAFNYQQEIESSERVIVGVNQFQSDSDPAPELMKIDEAIGKSQCSKLAELRAKRDSTRVDTALGALRTTAGSTQNLMPAILEAVKAYATIGEICNVLRDEFGVYRADTSF